MGPDDVPTVLVEDLPADPAGDDTLFVLDVREPDEWAAGHIDGAVHIPMGELVARIEEIPRSTRVIAVCRSGRRSAAVTAYLADGGWDAHNLDGGMITWAALGRPMTADTPGAPFVL
ncbi:rhodanese-like domain-containing protein [Frankia sp. CNm7]|uniref:Rhodanese-like domain-containing protein n=1 Tax=Frankia nepalensis TaxID=1836974 RepID=A0A937USW1_9ACTN|nr:rhodanese-like domain-containing protein [Frankia nepalensis]MBL7502246.1 rhodanese-like domain-containing protein [Frankia nepalensis]MBL7515935.1 rhodanese-like domain-containing protein [Frankia nepalensis]MBL7519012.1 rhodanese-like domain-containing protein [Frankia nepalensis]MBL7632518.1 rhodanese-like domain-containing protein [Frankia nepalensis]